MLKHTSLIIFILFNISYLFKNYDEISSMITSFSKADLTYFDIIPYHTFEPSIILPISNSSSDVEPTSNIDGGYYESTDFEEKYLVY